MIMFMNISARKSPRKDLIHKEEQSSLSTVGNLDGD